VPRTAAASAGGQEPVARDSRGPASGAPAGVVSRLRPVVRCPSRRPGAEWASDRGVVESALPVPRRDAGAPVAAEESAPPRGRVVLPRRPGSEGRTSFARTSIRPLRRLPRATPPPTAPPNRTAVVDPRRRSFPATRTRRADRAPPRRRPVQPQTTSCRRPSSADRCPGTRGRSNRKLFWRTSAR
jgi:hypothetical protein